ncbi:MAG: hypothetical protein JSW23_03095 [Planctomycetota bacterium]|nr:MAG: hypothetical protein JSW23_03095 [Planctomycetota bacterium]
MGGHIGYWAENGHWFSGKVFERLKICEKFGKSYEKECAEVGKMSADVGKNAEICARMAQIGDW